MWRGTAGLVSRQLAGAGFSDLTCDPLSPLGSTVNVPCLASGATRSASLLLLRLPPFLLGDWPWLSLSAPLATPRSWLPKRPRTTPRTIEKKAQNPVSDNDDDIPNDAEAAGPSEPEAPPLDLLSAVSTELRTECGKARAILNANVAACYVKLVRNIAQLVTVSLTVEDILCRVNTRKL